MSDKPKSALDLFLEANPEMKPQIPGSVAYGWGGPVAKALEQLKLLSQETGVAISIVQIKEKFGALRLYISVDERSVGPLEITETAATHTRLQSTATPGSVRERAQAIVSQAEVETAGICEDCGAEDAAVGDSGTGWHRCLCAGCRAAMLKRLKGGRR